MHIESMRGKVSDEEWQVRVNLAAFHRIVSQLGMTDVIYNHITARVPETEDQFLINLLGLDYSEITASSLAKIDMEGNAVLASSAGGRINQPGFVIHSAIHAARHDVVCIAHAHTPASVAVASLKCGLLPLNQNAVRFTADLAYHDYEGPVLLDDEKDRLVADLGTRNTMILRNHGILVCGRSIPETYLNLWCLEIACRMQVQTLSCGQPLNVVNEAAINATEKSFARLSKYGGDLEWKAARRVLDKVTTDYLA